MNKIVLIITFLSGLNCFAQNDTIPGEAEYRKHYDCRYEKGNILLVQKKGKTLDYTKDRALTKNGFVIRMEAIYDLEFADGKRYRSGVIKSITNDSISITSTFNQKCADYEGIKYETFTYPIKSIRKARFMNDSALGIFAKRNIEDNYELIVKEVDKAKMCPAVLTFPKRNNEVKVCHYYLTQQGWCILYETNGYLDFMEYKVAWQ
ncbi:MAG: hypothetical protein QM710_00820 [Flavobacterium sp.]